QLLVARESDVALVEQVIDVRRQEQAVGAVKALSICRVSPRLDVTRFQVPRLIHPRHATEFLSQEDVGPEHPLTTPCSDKLLFERWSRDARVHDCKLVVRRLGRTLQDG